MVYNNAQGKGAEEKNPEKVGLFGKPLITVENIETTISKIDSRPLFTILNSPMLESMTPVCSS